MKKHLIVLIATVLTINNCVAQKVIRLYPGKAPGSEKWDWQEGEIAQSHTVYNVVDPALIYYPADAAKINGTAVMICPGGAFETLGLTGEGSEVAKWFNDRGIAAFVLKYRLERSLTSNPVREMNMKIPRLMRSTAEIDSIVKMGVADAKEGLKYIKQHAGEYHIAADRIGMMGFSAGGTLTSGVAISYDPENRPDFLIMVYPFLNAVNNQNVKPGSPPMFICAATNDPLNIAAQSANLYSVWIKAGNSAELHVYATGGHGFGMGKKGTGTVNWTERLNEWMTAQGYLTMVK